VRDSLSLVEIKIGVRNSSRELVLESTQTPDEVRETVAKAVADGGILSLTDERGRSVHVPAEALAYLEIGPAEVRRVGFGAV
jgi:hypothetical protein